MRWDERAARPCAYTGAPDNGMWIPERGLGDTDGILGDTDGISVTVSVDPVKGRARNEKRDSYMHLHICTYTFAYILIYE